MIILIGESASGKSSIEKELVSLGISKVTSYTTRPKRENEIDGQDYHFVSRNEFEQLVEDKFFLESATYNYNYYGVALNDCKKDGVVALEPCGLREVKRLNPFGIVTFYIKVPENERLIRLAKRGDKVIEIFRRVISDQGVFEGVEKEVDYVIDGMKSIRDMAVEILRLYKSK